MPKPKLPAYGGQAVVEGVMFGGPRVNVTAIRRIDQSIDFFEEVRPEEPRALRLARKTPFLRGLVAIVLSASRGAKHLSFSSERYEVDPREESAPPSQGKGSRWAVVLGVGVIGVLSFLLGKVLFTALPALLASFLNPWLTYSDAAVTNVVRNLVEGLIKAFLLVGYIWLIAQTPMVKRLFQYHGAEHKVINTFEAGEELTVENVRRHSRLHYRCGSSFMIFSVLVGVVVYSFFYYETTWERILDRLLLIPVVISLSYELLQVTNALRNVKGWRLLGYPGLWLQRLTTREPDDAQIEVAIASFQRMLMLENRLAKESQGDTFSERTAPPPSLTHQKASG